MKRIRYGVIGVGRMGMEHARNLKDRVPGAELTAVCARHEERARAAAAELGVEWFTDPKLLCESEKVDAVAIVSDTASHRELIRLALGAGKHVFCEKPPAETVEASLEIEELAAAHPELRFMMGFMRRFDRSYAAAKEKLERGDIGRLVMVRCNSQDPAAIIEGTLKYADHSAGIFLDLAVHDMDLIRWFTGSEPGRIMAAGGCYAYPQLGEHGDGDNVACLMENADGTMASIFAGRAAAHGTTVETELIGTKGALRIGSVAADSFIEVLGTHGVVRECYQDFITRWHDAYVAELEYFTACILTGTPAAPTAADGTGAVRSAVLCREAFRTGELVRG